jgi:hypothetical protein
MAWQLPLRGIVTRRVDRDWTGWGRVVFAALCDKLLDISPELDIIPPLATEWQWTDGNLLIVLFSVTSGLLPASGFVSPAESLSHNLAPWSCPLSSLATRSLRR